MASVIQRLLLARAALVAVLMALPAGIATVSAQTPPRPPGEVPYINFPPGVATHSRPARENARPPTAPAPKIDELTKRDRELQAIRGEQKKARESETRLRREIETIGNDRRKLNRS